MSRSGYSDDYGDDDPLAMGRWRGAVKRAIEGKRGQAFLRELADAMDAMEVRELIRDQLIAADGACCTIGVVCKARGLRVGGIDLESPEEVGALVGISRVMTAEIEYENDDYREESPADRWVRMRKWVDKHL